MDFKIGERNRRTLGLGSWNLRLVCSAGLFFFVFAGVIMFPLVLSVRWMWEVGNILLVSFGPCLLLTFLFYLTGIAAKSAVGIWKQ
jgi:hypothetical protein